jgi:cellulose synthase/poly-beta-1,6-N-acetylglucosamine synthase-like glycosyltransferase
MVFLYYRHRDTARGRCRLPARLPRVTVQLPLYNEMYVVDRLVDSVCRIRYPKDLLEIQILDDSVDETQEIAKAAVERYREEGFDIHYVHRGDRHGYKAGALDFGLRQAKGEFVLIFDADFVAPADILEKSLGHFDDPKVGHGAGALGAHQPRLLAADPGAVRCCSTGTSSSSTAGATARAGSSTSTAPGGVWRRDAIADAGGWQHDTLTEDLDLSYRAQMKGWRFVFLQDVVSPAEIPVEMNAFKSQQHRWAKGSIQTCKKLLPKILASDLPLSIKVESPST